MLKSILLLLLLSRGREVDPLKKELMSLQGMVDTTVSGTVPRAFSSKASFLGGYGVIVNVEVALELPPNPFQTPKTPEQVKALVSQRRKDLRDKLGEMMKGQIGKLSAIADTESLAIIVYILPNRAEAGEQPTQMVGSLKKAAGSEVVWKEFQ